MCSSCRSLAKAGVGVGVGPAVSIESITVKELFNLGSRSRMNRPYLNPILALPQRCRSRQLSFPARSPTLRLGPKPLLSLRNASNQAVLLSRVEDDHHMGSDSRSKQEEEEEDDQRSRYRDSSSDVRGRGWMESPMRPLQENSHILKARYIQRDISLDSSNTSHPSPPSPHATLPDQQLSNLGSTAQPPTASPEFLITLSTQPIISLLHQLDSSDLGTLSKRLISVQAIRPLRIIVDTISTEASVDESSVRTVLDVLLGSEERKLPDNLQKMVVQLVDSLSIETLEQMISGMSMSQVTHLVDSLISIIVVDDMDITARKVEIAVATLAKDGLSSTVTGIDIARRKSRIHSCFKSLIWLLHRNELNRAESLCSALDESEVLHRISIGYEGIESSSRQQLINISSEILISSREHLSKPIVHELMMSLQFLLQRERLKLRHRGHPDQSPTEPPTEPPSEPPTESHVQPWSDVVNLILQDSLKPGRDIESFLEIQNFLTKTKFSSNVFPLRQEVRESLYSALDGIPPSPKWKIYQRLLRRGQPPPPGESTLRLAEYIQQKVHAQPSFLSPDISILNNSLSTHRHTLSGSQWAEYIRILLNKRGYWRSACGFYDAALDDPEHCIEVAGDHRLTLTMVEALGTPIDQRPPRDREFAARVIREFAHASPSLLTLPRESLTSLAQSFVAVGATDAAYKVFGFILKSSIPPTEMDVAALLATAFHRNPEIAVRLLEQAINSRAMTSRAALEVVLKATERLEDTALIERIKEACKKMKRKERNMGGGE